jgi:hypothetical protein
VLAREQSGVSDREPLAPDRGQRALAGNGLKAGRCRQLQASRAGGIDDRLCERVL